MNQGITIELQFFMISILWGAIILLAYDQLRIIRRVISHNILFITLEDLIFWILASIFIFAMIYEKNSGTIRGFSIMGMGIGMVLYHYILSDRIVQLISRGILILLRPFSFIIKWLKKSFCFIAGKIRKLVNMISIQLKNRMKSVKISIYNHKQKRMAKANTKEYKKKSKKKDKKKSNKNSNKKSNKNSGKNGNKKSNKNSKKTANRKDTMRRVGNNEEA